MMKLEHLFENYDLARKASENWPCDRPVSEELLSGFRVSSNQAVPGEPAAADLVLLRICRFGETACGLTSFFLMAHKRL